METYQYSNFALISQHLIISICFLLLPLAASAQTQQGYVRTLGRPDAKGVALSGVAVRVKGEHNAVLSGADGSFAIALPGKKNGEAYVLQQVRKAGYELNEKGVIGRQFAFSDKVPLTLVMVSTSQLQADKQRIENTAYQVAERNYKARMEELERQRETGSLAAEQYRAEIQSLQDKFEKYQSLIDDLAEHYAHTDYDLLDEHDREICLCIERGDLDRADSLIHTLFDPVDVLRRNQEALAHIDQSEAQARQLLAQANEEMAAVLKQQEKDAKYLYQLYTIALARYDFDMGEKYLTTRAELDSTNIVWQFDIALFLKQQRRYAESRRYYERTLHKCRELSLGPTLPSILNNLGNLYEDMALFKEAEAALQEALRIRLGLAKDNPQTFEPELAMSLDNMACYYYRMKSYSEAEEMFKQALEIRRRLSRESPRIYDSDLAHTLQNMGVLYKQSQRYRESEPLFKEALEIRQRLSAEKPGIYEADMAATLKTIGNLYRSMQRYSESLEFCQKALEISLRLSKYNPVRYESDVAEDLGNIACLFSDVKMFTQSEQYFMEAIKILERLSQTHPYSFGQQLATEKNNMGLMYISSKDFAKGEKVLLSALEIRQRLAEYDSVYISDLAETQTTLASLYASSGQPIKSEQMSLSAITIFERLLPDNPALYEPRLAAARLTLGGAYLSSGRMDDGIRQFQEALVIFKRLAEKEPEVYKEKIQTFEILIERLKSGTDVNK